MFEKQIATITQHLFGSYLENVETYQVNFEPLTWSIEYKNLQLCRSNPLIASTPYQITSGCIGFLELKLSSLNIFNTPIEINIKNVTIQVQHQHGSVKGDGIANDEAQAQDGLVASILNFIQAIVHQTILNIHLQINDIHVRFKDPSSENKRATTIGLKLRNVRIKTTDKTWKPGFYSYQDVSLNKRLTIEHVAIYMDYDGDNIQNIWMDVLHNKRKVYYVLDTLNMEVLITYRQRIFGQTDAMVKAEVSMDTVKIRLAKSQYDDFLIFVVKLFSNDEDANNSVTSANDERTYIVRNPVLLVQSIVKISDIEINLFDDTYYEETNFFSSHIVGFTQSIKIYNNGCFNTDVTISSIHMYDNRHGKFAVLVIDTPNSGFAAPQIHFALDKPSTLECDLIIKPMVSLVFESSFYLDLYSFFIPSMKWGSSTKSDLRVMIACDVPRFQIFIAESLNYEQAKAIQIQAGFQLENGDRNNNLSSSLSIKDISIDICYLQPTMQMEPIYHVMNPVSVLIMGLGNDFHDIRINLVNPVVAWVNAQVLQDVTKILKTAIPIFQVNPDVPSSQPQQAVTMPITPTQEFTLGLTKLVVYFETKYSDTETPMLVVQTCFQAKLKLANEKVAMETSVDLQVACCNYTYGQWEWILEPIENSSMPETQRHCQPSRFVITGALSNGNVNISVTEKTAVEVTLTKNSLRTFQRIYGEFLEAGDEVDHRKIPLPYRLENHTGTQVHLSFSQNLKTSPVRFYINGEKQTECELRNGETIDLVYKDNCKQNKQVSSPLEHVNDFTRGNIMILSVHAKKFQFEVPITQHQVTAYSTNKLCTLVCSVDTREWTKLITLRGKFQVVNELSCPVIVHFNHSQGRGKKTVQPRQTVFMPFDCDIAADTVFAVPEGYTLAWSDIVKSQKTANTQPFLVCHKYPGLPDYYTTVVVLETVTDDNISCFQLQVKAGLTLTNHLPAKLYYVETRNKSIPIETGEDLNLTFINFDESGCIFCDLKIVGKNDETWHGRFKIGTGQHSSQAIFRGAKGTNSILLLIKRSNQNKLVIYSQFWIFNQTPFSFLLKTHGQKRNQRFRSKVDQGTKPAMISCANSCGVRLKLWKSKKWSSKFTLNEPSLFLKCIKSGKIYQIAVEVRPSRFQYTKFVIIKPRFVIENRTQSFISISEVDWLSGPNQIHVECDSSVPLWLQKDSPEVLVTVRGPGDRYKQEPFQKYIPNQLNLCLNSENVYGKFPCKINGICTQYCWYRYADNAQLRLAFLVEPKEIKCVNALRGNTFTLNVSMVKVGLSLVNEEKHEEILYARHDNVELTYTNSPTTMTTFLKVANILIANQLTKTRPEMRAILAPLLTTSDGPNVPFLELGVRQRNQASQDLLYLEETKANVRDFALNLDLCLLHELSEWFDMAIILPEDEVLELQTLSKIIYFKYSEVSPIKMIIKFSIDGSSKYLNGYVAALLDTFYLSESTIFDEFRLELPAIKTTENFKIVNDLTHALVSHYFWGAAYNFIPMANNYLYVVIRSLSGLSRGNIQDSRLKPCQKLLIRPRRFIPKGCSLPPYCMMKKTE